MLIVFFQQQTCLFSSLLCSCTGCRQGGECALAYCGLDPAAGLVVMVSWRRKEGAAGGCPAWARSSRASVPCASRAALPRCALFLASVHPCSSIPPQSDAACLSVGREGGDVGTVLVAPLLHRAGLRLPPPLAPSLDGSEDAGAGRRALCSPGTCPRLPLGSLRHVCF